MSKGEKAQRTTSIPRVKVIALVEDTEDGQPMTWAVVTGTVPLDALEVDHAVRHNNAGMAKAHALGAIDRLELLR